MKAFQKIFLPIALAGAMIVLSGCSLLDFGQNSEGQIPGEQTPGGEQYPEEPNPTDLVSDVVTEEEWEAAIAVFADEKNFENCKIEAKDSRGFFLTKDGVWTRNIVLITDGKKIYAKTEWTFKSEEMTEAEEKEITESNYGRDNGEAYWESRDDGIHIIGYTIGSGGKWRTGRLLGLQYDVCGVIEDSINIGVGSYYTQEEYRYLKFQNFKYSQPDNGYIHTEVDPTDGSIYMNAIIKFKGGKLVYYKYFSKYVEQEWLTELTFTYGGQSITIPDVEAEEFPDVNVGEIN